MRIGIYARKSRFSDNSDSVEAQIKMCEEYARNNHKVSAIIKYGEDEGYTGANTKRPGYIRLMNDIKEGSLDILMCYKIDRISRNVLDFSKTFNILQEYNVQFVSLKEQIDTSTPLGRAMMYICSVFAQMERETTAERVKDSMLELAKSGKWTGGRPPAGYDRKRITVNGKKHTMLIPIEEEVAFLNMIYDTFLQGHTLSSLETYFKSKGIQTLQGYYLSSTQIYFLLKSPHGVSNTKEIYDYFCSIGCFMANSREMYDGKNGLIVYGRTEGGRTKKHIVNTPDKWIVGIGMHEPIVPACKWLETQSRFGINTFSKTRIYEIGILKGILKCKCGYTMKACRKVDKRYNKVYDNYFCQRRNRWGKEHCDMSAVHIEKLDNMVIDYLKSIVVDKSLLTKYVKQEAPQCRTCDDIKKEIDKIQRKINNLTQALRDNDDSSAAKYIIKDIEKLDSGVTSLTWEMREAERLEREREKNIDNLDVVYNAICNYLSEFEKLDYQSKSAFLRDVIQECVWDGKDLIISF